MGAISLTPKLPWQLLIDEINALNTETGANFGVNDLTYVIKSKDNAAGTAVLTLSPASGTAYFNNRDVNYHRLDLAKWFKNVAVRVYTDQELTYFDAIKLIGERYGMVTGTNEYFLDPLKDFSDEDMATQIKFDDSGIQTISVTAKDDSLAWYGTLEFQVYNRALDLANIIKVTDLGLLKYVDDGDGSKTAARLVTYPVDLSAYGADLSSALTTAPLDGELVDEVVAAIVTATGISNAIATDLAAQLKLVKPTYVGTSAASTDTGVNPTFTNVVVVPLTATANIYGTAVLGFTLHHAPV